RDDERAGPGEGAEGADPARVDQRDLRRSADLAADGGLLGQRQSGGPARRVRRGQAVRRGDDNGVPPGPRGGHPDRPHLQHLRAADEAERRSRGLHVHHPGAERRGHHGVRRRLPDAQLLLRDRPRGRHPAAVRLERARSGERRQPRRDPGPPAGGGSDRADGSEVEARDAAAAAGRPEAAPARHHPRADDPQVGAQGVAPRRPRQDHRLLQVPPQRKVTFLRRRNVIRYNSPLMKKPLVLGTVLAALAACSSPPPKENLPDRSTSMPERRAKSDEIVALFNGEPVTWQAVAEKVLELNLRESVDQYVRWRIVEDRKKALGISHTPEELRKRAAAYLEQIKKQLGEEKFRQQLTREGVTEESKRAQIEGSAFLSQVLTLDKIVRFAALLEDQMEIDRAYFADEGEARKFREAAASKGFDAAAKELPAERTSARGRLPREVFPQTAPPADPVLDPWIVTELEKLPPGGITGVEMSRSNLYYVVRLQGIRRGREAVYSQVRDEIL